VETEADIAEISRRLAASPETVFRAFADAQLVSQWLSPSPEVTLVVLAFDFRVGGRYRFAYHLPDGQTMFVNGAYQAIEAPSRIVFSWNIEPPDEHAGLESVVSVTITRVAGGADLLIRHARLTQPGSKSRHAEGWRGALDRLEKLPGLTPHERTSP
jgi:uncharacterized protein YndB with AHSA1/START domain